MLTRSEIEALVREDYEAVAGKVVLLRVVECYDDRDSSQTVSCDPPAVARIDVYSEGSVRSELLRWTDSAHCDPYLDITVLEPHPAFADVRPSWVHGRSRSTDGTIEEPDFTLADEAMQERYRDAPALDHETNGGCAPEASSPAP